MNRYPVDGPPSIQDLEGQVDRCLAHAAQAQARPHRLKAGTTEFTRPPGRCQAITKAEADVAGAKQGLRNTEPILRPAAALRGREPP